MKINESKVKYQGKVYTPDYLVDIILDQANYMSCVISRKHVVDNSCGNGQFMVHIVDRYCKDYFSRNTDSDCLKAELETYIHAIEIDSEELEVCKSRCSSVSEFYGISNVNWDFICADATEYDGYHGRMDFVVGNPPYVRVHNLKNYNEVKKYDFAEQGMTDLYIVFYELGLSMLNNRGRLCYITPSSFFTSLAGLKMRAFFVYNQMLQSICDLKHFHAFNAATYTAIVSLCKERQQTTLYYEFDEESKTPVIIDSLEIEDYYINGLFYFSTKEKLNKLKGILNSYRQSDILVKNGYATLSDKTFIGDFQFDSNYIIPVIKASKGQRKRIIYPYDKNGRLIEEQELKQDKNVYEFLLSHKNALMKRDSEKDSNLYWYSFGRSQAIGDTYKDKLSVNTLVKSVVDLKIVDAPSGTGVYSGLYIISREKKIPDIKRVLYSEEFIEYIKLLGKYKSGGYYTYSSKDIKIYLDYKLGKEMFSDVD